MRDGGVILFKVGFKSQDRAGTRQQQGREINISEYNAAGFSRRTASSPFVRAETVGGRTCHVSVLLQLLAQFSLIW